MRSTIIRLPGAAAVNPSQPAVSVEPYDERIASWDGLIGYFSPEHVQSWAPIRLEDRAGDVAVSNDFANPGEPSPTKGAINGQPAFLGGRMRAVGNLASIPKTCTLAFVVEFVGTLPDNTFTLMAGPGGGYINFQTGGTRPAYTNPSTYIPQPMPTGTIAAANTPYLFVWGWDEVADTLRRQVNGVTDVVTAINSKVPLTDWYFRTNHGVAFPFRLSKVFVFDRDLHAPENAALKADVVDFLREHYGVSW